MGLTTADILFLFPNSLLYLRYNQGNITFRNVELSTNLTMLCDPMVSPPEGYPKWIATTNCQTLFEWRTLYACPQCSSAHWSWVLGECFNGQHRKVYYWKTTPPLCHGGSGLPPDEFIPCSEIPIPCLPGQYYNGKNCTDCSPGYYSIGGGFELTQFPDIPDGFTTSCSGPQCQFWSPQYHFISSGTSGLSTLTFASNFTQVGRNTVTPFL